MGGLKPGQKTYIGNRLFWYKNTVDSDFGFNTTTDGIKELNPIHHYKIDLKSLEHQTHPTESQIN